MAAILGTVPSPPRSPRRSRRCAPSPTALGDPARRRRDARADRPPRRRRAASPSPRARSSSRSPAATAASPASAAAGRRSRGRSSRSARSPTSATTAPSCCARGGTPVGARPRGGARGSAASTSSPTRALDARSSSGCASATRTRARSSPSTGAARPTRTRRRSPSRGVAERRPRRPGLATHWGRKVLEVRPPIAARQGPRRSTGCCATPTSTPRSTSATTAPTSTRSAGCASWSRAGGSAHAVCVGVRSEETPGELEAAADLLVDGPPGVRGLLEALLGLSVRFVDFLQDDGPGLRRGGDRARRAGDRAAPPPTTTRRCSASRWLVGRSRRASARWLGRRARDAAADRPAARGRRARRRRCPSRRPGGACCSTGCGRCSCCSSPRARSRARRPQIPAIAAGLRARSGRCTGAGRTAR